MKKVIQDADYAEISYDSELKLGKIRWKRKTSTEEYQYSFITLLGFAKENQIEIFLSDIRDQQVVAPDNKRWLETEMLPKAMDVGLKRAGVIFDGNVFKKYYINMIIKVTNKFGLPMKVFNTEEEAMAWVKEFC
ncbi:MAG: STAS/SEC14 domain-containing protein [Bacteroidales bacterium]|nr:STAS/SEC14 domain-containing protein [Bacteroidales bacterium]